MAGQISHRALNSPAGRSLPVQEKNNNREGITVDLQSILGKLFANAGAVGIEGVFQFIFSAQQAYWYDIKTSQRTELGRTQART